MRSPPVGAQGKPRPVNGDGREIPELLRLFGAAVPGAILLALADGPLRTKELTTLVRGFTPRTVYRYADRLGKIGAIEREEEPGVPSKVVHSLTDSCGIELSELVGRFAEASLQMLPGGEVVPHAWDSIKLLAELWESGMYTELDAGPSTATELARVGHDLSFHQVSRRLDLLMIGGLISEKNDGLRRRRYELTEQARRGVGLIAGLGGWRESYVVPTGEAGLTLLETADAVRAVIPLVVLPGHADEYFKLTVALPRGVRGEGEVIWVKLGADGQAAVGMGPVGDLVSWGRSGVPDWITALTSGDVKVQTGGAGSVTVDAWLQEMHPALWTRPEGI